MQLNTLKFDRLSRNTIIIFLGAIILFGIGFRLIFTHFDIPLNQDNLQYFFYAIDHSLGETKESFQVFNNGWPLLLSFFFTLFESNNYLDYMALQKIISIIISSLTAIPIYFLTKKFFPSHLALLGCALFVFEPRIVQNSTFGITDPLYIMGLTIAIVFLFSCKKNFEFISFIILGLSITVRSEGLLMIPAFIIIYLWQKKKSKESIIRISISLLILIIILSVVVYQRNIEMNNDGLYSRINYGIEEIYTSSKTDVIGGPLNLLIDGFINFIKFLGWSQIPVWLLFAPAGFIILLHARNQNTGIIIILLFFIALPTLYAYSFINETRYLFPLYPIFSLLSLFLLNKIVKKNKINPITINTIIILGLVISSSSFLVWKDIDIEKEKEMFAIMKTISDNEKIINNFGYETTFNIPVVMENKNFPSNYNELIKNATKIINIPKVNSINEYMNLSYQNELTHLVIKKSNKHVFLNDIFENEDKYSSILTKEYDFQRKGLNFHIKIFKINNIDN